MAAKRALLIGSSYDGLPGTENDVETMANTLKSHAFGVDNSSYVTKLCNNHATRQNILDAWEKLIADSVQGDAVVIFYSGHGGLAVSDNAREASQQPDQPDQFQFLVPDDYDPKLDRWGGILDTEQSAWQYESGGKWVGILTECLAPSICDPNTTPSWRSIMLGIRALVEEKFDNGGMAQQLRSLGIDSRVPLQDRTEHLQRLPRQDGKGIHHYSFNTSAWSILPGKQSLGYDTKNIGTAVGLIGTYVSGGTNINTALTTVLGQRDASKPRCSIIVITDGLDWGVAAAMQTVQKNAVAASAQSKLLRVFVMGLGDDVSRGMCETLARAGFGATAYISESQLQERDHQAQKAQTLINSINRAPLRVRSIDWGMAPAPTQLGTASGSNLVNRPTPNQGQLGAAAKGDNVPPPKSIQQARLPRTMFWAVRSYWYAIIHGNPTSTTPKVKIRYDISGRANSTKEIEVRVDRVAPGTVFHSLAARALIQTLEDKATSITDPTERYWNECEIVRLGKTHSLASTQTSFVATMNGVGTVTNTASNAAPGDRSTLSGAASLGNEFGLHFVSTRGPASPASSVGWAAAGFQINGAVFKSQGFDGDAVAAGFQANGEYARSASAGLYSFAATREALPSVDSAQGGEGRRILDELLAAQDADGAFGAGAVEHILFPGTGIPAVPAFVAVLEGCSNVKNQIWLATCVVAFLEKKYVDRTSEWPDARAKAERFIKTTRHCIFGVDCDRADRILADSLDDARGYFY